MTVYVDDIQEYKAPAFKHPGKWCHMMATDLKELHAMADRIGLRRAWFQDHPLHPHYDLVPGKRALAVKFGAVPVRAGALVELCGRKRIAK